MNFLQDLSLKGKITNTTANDIAINYVITLPRFYTYSDNAVVDAAQVAVDTTSNITNLVSAPSQIKVGYSYVSGKYRTLDRQLADAAFSFDQLKAIQFTGTLKAGETITLDIPFALSNKEDIASLMAEVLIFLPIYTNTSISLNRSSLLYNVADYMYGQFAGAYRYTQPDGKMLYRQVPLEIQQIMPAVTEDQFIFTREYRLYYPGNQVDLTIPSESAAYTDTKFAIKTDKIFEAIKDEGFSVFADQDRGLWNAYVYTMTSGLQFFDEDGERVVLGATNKDGILLSPYYVELHKIFETKPITIYVNDAWDEFDNLVLAQKLIERSSAQAEVLTHDEITVEHNVDNTVPGVYKVTYKYEVAPGKWVTKTDTVTVLSTDPVTPEDPVKPEDPVTPEDPKTPEVPENPVTPVVPDKKTIDGVSEPEQPTLPLAGSYNGQALMVMAGVMFILAFIVLYTSRKKNASKNR